MVYANVVLILRLGLGSSVNRVAVSRSIVGSGRRKNGLRIRHHPRINEGRWDYLPGEDLTRMGGWVRAEGIVYLAGLVVGSAAIVVPKKWARAEIPSQLSRRGHQDVGRTILVVTQPLVGKEKECFVSAIVELRNPDWPAD